MRRFSRIRAPRRIALPGATSLWRNPYLRVALVVIGAYFLVALAVAPLVYRGSRALPVRVVEALVPYPALYVNGEPILLSRVRFEVAARTTYRERHGLQISDADIWKSVLDQLTERVLYRQDLERKGLRVSQDEVDTQLDQVVQEAGGRGSLEKYLEDSYGSEVGIAEFRRWLEEAAIEATVQQRVLVSASARHILVSVAGDAPEAIATQRRQRAEEVRSQLAADLSRFAELAREYSDDASTRDAGGNIGTTTRGNETPVYSADFENALFTLPIGELSQPVRSGYGWHLIVVDERDGSIDQSPRQYLEGLRSTSNIRVLTTNP